MPRTPEPYSTEYLLLGLIQANPIHPYDLHKHLSDDADLRLIWRFNQSQLYATVDKLEKAGLIFSTISDGSAFPFRKIYRITDSGADLFEDWLLKPVENQRNLRRDFLMKLYFLMDAPLELYDQVFKNQLSCCFRWLDRQEANLADLEAGEIYRRAVFRFRVLTTRSNIEWLKDCLAMRLGSGEARIRPRP